MKIALIAPPFVPVPPKEYGGSELFIAHLAVNAVLQPFSEDTVRDHK